MRIGLLSDTHGYFPERVFEYFKDCDEIWHAGDIGSVEVLEKLRAFKPTRAVWGNIDGQEVRKITVKDALFFSEKVKVFMTHIGGYPGRYNKEVYVELLKHKPQLFICGHSHILKVQYDQKLKLLHINPGACGNHGWHKVLTIVRFEITDDRIHGLEVIELGERGTDVTHTEENL